MKFFECLRCGQRVQGHSAFVQHRYVCGAGIAYKCDGCQKFFSERYNLSKHQRLGKCAGPAQMHQCTRCGRGFQARRFMLQHTEMCGVGKFNCKICSKVFSLKSSLTRHELSCGRPKEFFCNLCGEACSGQQELVYHKRICPSKQTVATKQVRHSCDKCGKTFLRQFYLDKHISSCTRTRQCDKCDEEFETATLMNSHYKVSYHIIYYVY